MKQRTERFGAVPKRKLDAGSDEAQKKRAERFGLPLKGSKTAAVLEEQAATASENTTTATTAAADIEKMKQRALRFGMPDAVDEEKRQKRAERFAPKTTEAAK